MLDSGIHTYVSTAASEGRVHSAPARETESPAIQLHTSLVARAVPSELTWTFASIVSLTGHLWTLTALVLAAMAWEFWALDTLFPAGDAAGGRAAGSNAAGLISVAPGFQDAEDGDFEETGGIITFGAPQQIGNLASVEHEVAGEVLAAKKRVESEVSATAPSPTGLPTTNEPKVTEVVTTRASHGPSPENHAEPFPQAVVSRRIATSTVTTDLAAATLVVTSPTATPELEVQPPLPVRADVPKNVAVSAVSRPMETPANPEVRASAAIARSVRQSEGPADTPQATEETNGSARRAGTRLLAQSTIKAEIDKPGAGGGAGGPGGRGGSGGRGGQVSEGPGGADSGRTNGSEGDLRSLIVSAPKPIYPRELDAAGISGRVLVRVEIDAEGRVLDVKVHQSSGYAAFDRSALEGIMRWRFARLIDKPWRGSLYVVPVLYRD